MRKDYGQIILFGMISIIILWIMKYVLPYFLPFAVALITVVPLHASFIRKGRADKKGADSDRQSWQSRTGMWRFRTELLWADRELYGSEGRHTVYLAGKSIL